MSYTKSLVYLLLACAGPVFAQALPVGVSPVFAPTVTSGGLSYAGGVASAANASSVTFANAANGAVYAQATQKIALGGGATADIVLRSAPSAANIGAAVGRFAAKVATPLVVGVALYDLAKEMGYSFDQAGNPASLVKQGGQTQIAVPTCGSFSGVGQSIYSSSDGYTYTTLGSSNGNPLVYPPGVMPVNSCVAPDAQYGTEWQAVALRAGGWNYWPAIYRTLGNALPSTASDWSQFTDAVAAKSGWPSGSAIGRALTDAIASGQALPLPKPQTITGPSSVPLSPSVVTNPDGSTTIKTPTKTITYSPPDITVTDTTTQTDKDAAGNTTGTSSTAAPAEMPETCGYPGGPPCKIDETGTPDALGAKPYNPQAEAVKNAKDAAAATISGTSDKAGLFSGWSVLWSAPAVVACTPYVLPNWNGQSMGALDPCPVVDGVRLVMGYLWAFAGLMMCIGFVRESIQLG